MQRICLSQTLTDGLLLCLCGGRPEPYASQRTLNTRVGLSYRRCKSRRLRINLVVFWRHRPSGLGPDGRGPSFAAVKHNAMTAISLLALPVAGGDRRNAGSAARNHLILAGTERYHRAADQLLNTTRER